MRTFFAMALLVVVGLVLPLSSGCAHSLGGDPALVAVEAKGSGGGGSDERPIDVAPVVLTDATPAAATRPRLSRTVTLGEGTTEPVYIPTAQAPQGAGQPGPGVVVNNNITVLGAPPVGYGGYGGYGGRTSSGGYMREGSGSHVAWASSGWEGAGRTASPGHTPHVGGNWSSPPSYGPRQLK